MSSSALLRREIATGLSPLAMTGRAGWSLLRPDAIGTKQSLEFAIKVTPFAVQAINHFYLSTSKLESGAYLSRQVASVARLRRAPSIIRHTKLPRHHSSIESDEIASGLSPLAMTIGKGTSLRAVAWQSGGVGGTTATLPNNVIAPQPSRATVDSSSRLTRFSFASPCL